MKTKLTKGIMIVLTANVLNMIFSVITNLILPKNLSTDSYAAIKTYQLYLSYVGILHFGFVDGIYLRYGGADINCVDKSEIETDLYSFRIFQIVILIIGLIASLILKDPILAIVSVMILPTNLLNFFKYLFQACGEYNSYARIINIVAVATFAVNIILIEIVHTDNYLYYLLGYLAINLIIWVVVEHKFRDIMGFHDGLARRFSFNALFENMRDGILLTLGNFASTLTTTMDRWFVKFLIGTTGFAQYAFAVSMENFLNTAVTPVSITLYNAFCTDNDTKTVNRYRRFVIVFASIIVAAAFPVKFITEVYLQKYQSSIYVVFLLFAAQMFYIVIKSIYVNLYKARKLQKTYFLKLIISLLAGLLFNIIASRVYNIKESYAFATMLSAIFWFILVQFDFKEHIDLKEALYLIIECTIFIYVGFKFNSIMGFIIYACSVVLVSLIFLRNTVFDLVKTARGFIRHK